MKKITPFLILLLLLISCGSNPQKTNDAEAVKEPTFLYGICIDSLNVVEGQVQKNEFLANILQKEGVS